MGYFFDTPEGDAHAAITVHREILNKRDPAPPPKKREAFVALDADRLVKEWGARPPEGVNAAGWLAVTRLLAADACEVGAPQDGKGGPAARMWASEGAASIILPHYARDRFVHRYSRAEAFRRLAKEFPQLEDETVCKGVARWVDAYEGGRS